MLEQRIQQQFFDSADVEAKLSIANSTVPAASAARANPDVAKNPDVAGFGAPFKLGAPEPATPSLNPTRGPGGRTGPSRRRSSPPGWGDTPSCGSSQRAPPIRHLRCDTVLTFEHYPS